ncbi:uncharacterized protein LOC100376127 [Saccoglossus kowalevskii]|uniref:Uncharacterized protein LOC100376127 n=1 Tax=Saccoglossus kowalevskii TaxID=10224 RepID=A0ABM0GW84_SACKO|nr:PREDICTED: uncharacterized protein LOC100376127 [Saccoglossus kowalevskii]
MARLLVVVLALLALCQLVTTKSTLLDFLLKKYRFEEMKKELAPSRFCAYSCSLDGNGVCDDGGEGSVSSMCPFGMDCTDCGIRYAYCDNTCQGAGYDWEYLVNDHVCDDGVAGDSQTDFCDFGTDCTDCGPRVKK